MPTGYTRSIAEGISFEDFLSNCMCAFDDTIEFRDESLGVEIPVFKPSTYNRDRLLEAKKRFRKISKWTVSFAIEVFSDESSKAYQNELEYRRKKISEMNSLRRKYLEMRDFVLIWVSPSRDHDRLKRFMLEQIDRSVDFDCNTSHYEEDLKQKTPEQYLADELLKLKRDIEYHQREWDSEVRRVRMRNWWVRTAKKSLEISSEIFELQEERDRLLFEADSFEEKIRFYSSFLHRLRSSRDSLKVKISIAKREKDSSLEDLEIELESVLKDISSAKCELKENRSKEKDLSSKRKSLERKLDCLHARVLKNREKADEFLRANSEEE